MLCSHFRSLICRCLSMFLRFSSLSDVRPSKFHLPTSFNESKPQQEFQCRYCNHPRSFSVVMKLTSVAFNNKNMGLYAAIIRESFYFVINLSKTGLIVHNTIPKKQRARSHFLRNHHSDHESHRGCHHVYICGNAINSKSGCVSGYHSLVGVLILTCLHYQGPQFEFEESSVMIISYASQS